MVRHGVEQGSALTRTGAKLATGAQSELAAFLQGRRGLARLGAAAIAVLTLAVGVHRLFDEALPGQDHWATLNSSLGYMQRTFPSDEFIGSATVAEDARLWMPRDAHYRVVVGDRYAATNSPWSYAAPNFLTYLLLPRRRVDAQSAKWVVCIGCERSALGSFEVLSDGGNGVLFGRVRP